MKNISPYPRSIKSKYPLKQHPLGCLYLLEYVQKLIFKEKLVCSDPHFCKTKCKEGKRQGGRKGERARMNMNINMNVNMNWQSLVYDNMRDMLVYSAQGSGAILSICILSLSEK